MTNIETNLFPCPVPQADGYGITLLSGSGTPATGKYTLVASTAGGEPTVSFNDPSKAIPGKATTFAVKVVDRGNGCHVRLSGDYYNPDGSYNTWADDTTDWKLGAYEERYVLLQFPYKNAALGFKPTLKVMAPKSDLHNGLGDNAANFEDPSIDHYWAGSNGATPVISTDRAVLGTKSLKVTTTAGQKATLKHTAMLSGDNIPWDFCAMTFTAQVSAATAITGNYSIYFSWYDANWAWLGDSTATKTTNALAGLTSAWKKIRHTTIVPAGAQNFDIMIVADTAPTSAETWYMDGCRLEQGERPRFPTLRQDSLPAGAGVDITEVCIMQDSPLLVDGIPVVGKPGCSWAGTANRSATVRKTTVPYVKQSNGWVPKHPGAIPEISNGTTSTAPLSGDHYVMDPLAPVQPFTTAGGPWTQKASEWTLHPNSANIINYVLSKADPKVRLVGTAPEVAEKWGAGLIYRATTSDPQVSLTSPPATNHDWLYPQLKNPLYIPSGAVGTPNSDSSLQIIQPDGTVVTLWQFFRQTMTASAGNLCVPGTNGTPRDVVDGSTWPAGDPRNTGAKNPWSQIITRFDMARGVIDRSILGFLPPLASSNTRYEYPAELKDGTGTDPNVMVYGWRLCIKASVNLSSLNLHPTAYVVAKMLQDYGSTITDRNGTGDGLTMQSESQLISGTGLVSFLGTPSLFAAIPLSAANWEVRYHPTAKP